MTAQACDIAAGVSACAVGISCIQFTYRTCFPKVLECGYIICLCSAVAAAYLNIKQGKAELLCQAPLQLCRCNAALSTWETLRSNNCK